MVIKSKMKCPICNGKTVLSKYDSKLFGGKVIVKNNPIYKCTKCGEGFATSELFDKGIENASNAFCEFNFERDVISTGGSLGITFPSDLLRFCSITKGSKIRLVPKSKTEISLITNAGK